MDIKYKGKLIMRKYEFKEIDSTNEFLKKQPNNNKDLVIAETQTNGRGRRGNRWVSNKGAALFSFVLKYDCTISENEYMKLPILVGYSLLNSMKKIENLDYRFKWTNDIYLDDKKISGILVERVRDEFIIGIGININNYNLEEVSEIAISLTEKTNKIYDVKEIIELIVDDFFKNLEKFKNNGWKEILENINKLNYLYGKRVDIVTPGRCETGIVGDILNDGMLEVFMGDEIKKYNVGEIHIKNNISYKI